MKMIRPTALNSTNLDATTAEDEILTHWEPAGLPYFERRVRDLDYSSAGLLAMSLQSESGKPDEIRIYDDAVPPGENYALVFPGTGGPAIRLAWSDSGTRLAASFMGRLTIYDLDGNVVLNVTDPELRTGDFYSRLYWINDDAELMFYHRIVDSSGNVLFLRVLSIDTSTGALVKSFDITLSTGGLVGFQQNDIEQYRINCLGISNDEARIYIGLSDVSNAISPDGGIVEWEPASGNSRGIATPEGVAAEIETSNDNAIFAARLNTSLYLYDQSTLDLLPSADQPDLTSSGQEIKWVRDTDELLFRRSVSPRLVVFDSVNFAHQEITGLPNGDLPTFSARVISGKTGAYAIGYNDLGFRVIDSSTRAVIEAQNPTFQENDLLIYEEKIYESLLDNNNDRPDQGAQKVPATWFDLGFVNTLRMFDGAVSSVTGAGGVLEFTVTPGSLVNSIALLNLSGSTARITMNDPEEGQVYDSGEIELIDSSTIGDWYGFYFEPYVELTEVARTDLPPFPDASITVVIDAEGGDASLGQIILGTIFNIGQAQYGTSIGIEDFSRKETDVFGNFDVVERGFANLADYDVVIEPGRTSGVRNVLARFRATPAVYIGNENFPETIVYGYYRDFDIILSNPGVHECTITVEGLQ